MSTVKQKDWYVGITYRRERLIKQRLEKDGIEVVVPMRNIVRVRAGKEISVSRLVVPGYVFIHTDIDTAIGLVMTEGLNMRLLRNKETYKPCVITEKQMQDFLFLLTYTDNDRTRLVSPVFKVGTKVRVVKGDFAGIEGELIRICGHKRVVVRMDNFLAVATSYIPASFLEEIK